MNLDLPLLSYAQQRRDIALAIVEGNNQDWADIAFQQMKFIRFNSSLENNYPLGFTPTDVRRWIEPTCGRPKHPNAWGAFTMRCVKAGLIEDTGRTSRTGAHARKQTVYRWLS